MAAGEQVPLEPALAQVLGQDLHHAPGVGEVLVGRGDRHVPDAVGHLEHVAQTVGGGLVRAEQAKRLRVAGDDVAHEPAEDPRRLGLGLAGGRHRDRVGAEVRQRQLPQQLAAVGVRVGAHPLGPVRRERGQVRHECPMRVEELVRPVRAQPVRQDRQMRRVVAYAGDRDLVGTPGTLDREPVDHLRARPALGRAQDDHRPADMHERPAAARGVLDLGDLVDGDVERVGQVAVHLGGLVAGDHERAPAVAGKQRGQLVVGDAREDRRVGDLVAVQVQDRQHGPVDGRTQKACRVPARRQGTGLGLPVADDACDQQIGIVEGRAEGMGERVAELAALVDRTGRLGCGVARDAAGKRELAKQLAHAVGVRGDVGVALGVGALEVRVGDESGPAVSGAGDEDRIQRAGADQAV